jgi:PAS domain S-box-containing protein
MAAATAHSDWAAAVDAIVRRTPSTAAPPNDLRAQVRLLALLTSSAPLNVLLDGLATYVETWADGLHCTVLLADNAARLLLPGASPSVPASYVQAIGPVPIVDGCGCCGTAAARREMVVVEDIETSPLWTAFVSIARGHGLRACWSVPILDDARSLLGTLALYYRERRSPSPQETELIRFASSLAAFVIQRHRDTERLRSSQARLDAAIWGTEIGLWESTSAGDFLWLNSWCERFDIDPCIGRGGLERWMERIHPDDLEAYMRSDLDCLEGHCDHYAVEYRIRNQIGEWRWVHERGRVASRGADGAPLLAGVCIDVHNQKKTAAALRAAEDRYELAINAARLPVWEYDIERDIVTGNVYWHRTLGYAVDDQLVREHRDTWLSGIHPDDRAAHERIYASEAADATGFYQSEFRQLGANGTYRWLLDRARVVERAADGSPSKVVGISLDIDDRRQMETALRASLHEKEVLLQEIHHRVKNNLQIISSLVGMQMRRVRDASSRETLEQCQHRVQAIALIHEKLYQSSSLASVPLPDYVRSLTQDIMRAASSSATSVALEFTLADITLPIDTAIPCGLILNELITNALKHAFPGGRQGRIRISIAQPDAGRLQLSVIDNGVGMPAGIDVRHCRTMGLQLVNTLAGQLAAELEVNVAEGTCVQLTFPLERKVA